MAVCPSCSGTMPDGASACAKCGAVIAEDITRLPDRPADAAGTPVVAAGIMAAPTGNRSSQLAVSPVRASSTPPPRGSDVYTAGTVLADRYRVVGLLGRGGMGEVYRADDLTLAQPVALKFLPRHLEDDSRLLVQLLDEVRAARAVSHANVCRVYDVGQADGRHFLSMEFVDGEDLATSLRRIGRFPVDKGLEIARQLCAGLAAVHERRLLHRDLKPANVMLDGRGKVRLTDFGLAGELDERTGTAGTPGYMAPEQLAGGPGTVASDIYALGLVLYEVFTGRRAFEGATIAELRARQERDRPLRMASTASGIDPAIEEVVFRCLDPNPSRRPASALLVAAELPGGDPLAAALAAGETPSPAMVAAAGQHQSLSPRVAGASLAVIGVLLAAVLTFIGSNGFTRIVPLPYPPDVLENTAQNILRQFGYVAASRDSARGFAWNQDLVRWQQQHAPKGGRWTGVRDGYDPGVLFWYRTSPRQLLALGFFSEGVATGAVTEDDPPFRLASENRVWLSSTGRLLRFEAIPLEKEAVPTTPPPAVDWKRAFDAAGLEAGWFASVEPTWAPQAWGDSRVAWEGHVPGTPTDRRIRVEAASWRGRPISFRVIHEWTRADRQESSLPQDPISQAIGLTVIGGLAIGGIVLARRNVRLERSDTRGARRLASLVFIGTLVAWALEADHVTAISELLLAVVAVSMALFASAVTWTLYTSLEPYVRRRWPHTIITWNRLLAGQTRDPLVGRDLLIGIAGGLAQCILVWSSFVLVRQFGRIDPDLFLPSLAPLVAPRYILTALIGILYSSIVSTLGMFVLLFLLRLVLRREWLAVATFVAGVGVAGAVQNDPWWLAGPLSLAAGGLVVLVLLRFGLVAYVVCNFVTSVMTRGFPMSAQPERWYTGPSLFVISLLVVAALYGYRLATRATAAAPDRTVVNASA